MQQPAFVQADANRVLQSRRLLWTLVENSRQAQMKLMGSRQQYASLSSEIATIEAKLVALQQELANKKSLVNTAKAEVDEMEQRIKVNSEKKAGLCIRTLNKKTLSHMLSYLGKDSGAYLTCKYWKVCVDEVSN
eukprot:scaffold1885_cov161-Ochromonas_danica.AAC.10